jgi:hypothetical protein
MGIQAPSERNFCAEYSRIAGEDLAGTVKPVDLWLLIEYRGRWERDAISVFPELTRQRLSALRSGIPKMRLALIKQTGRSAGPLSMFWAFAREREPRLYRAEFDDYRELIFDADHLRGETGEKLFAVCTHGTHDLCCAKFGNKIYSDLREFSDNVWQISHVGGCRFAPNLVCLPHGIVYGRVEKADCAAIVSAYNGGAVVASKLRGRSCYPKPVQAAESFLRSSVGLTDLDELTLLSAAETVDRHWCITFISADSTQHRVSIVAEDGQVSTFKSCAAGELSPRDRFRLIDCA